MIEQGSRAWFAQRCGKVTASRVADIIAKTKSGPAASRKNYLAQLVAERLTGNVEETFTSAAMQHGIDTEPQARAAYAFLYGVEVEGAGFVQHPSIEAAGASPDGFVGAAGLLEIKCPNTATHIDSLTSQSVPSRYLTQIYWQLACTGRAWCDFVSFDPRMPVELQMFVERVHRDDERIAELEAEVKAFLSEVEAKVAELETLKMKDAA